MMHILINVNKLQLPNILIFLKLRLNNLSDTIKRGDHADDRFAQMRVQR